MGLSVAESLVGLVGLVAADGEAELPEVDANLVGAASDGAGLEEGGAIGEPVEDVKFSFGGQAVFGVDFASAELACFSADRGVDREAIFFGLALDAHEVDFFDATVFELHLDGAGKVAGASDDDQAGGVGV